MASRCFVTSDGRFRISIASPAIASMLELSAKAGGVETGGILIGRYSSDRATATIEKATESPRDSKGGARWFRRGASGLRSLLERLWTSGLHYVGEWHLHPGASPDPSTTDAETMWSIARNEAYACAEPILVVVGGQKQAGVATMHVEIFTSARTRHCAFETATQMPRA